jgi:hypothetical protein
MTSIDFAAAQQRVLSRRQFRTTESKARLKLQAHQQASNKLTRLPFPLGSLARKGSEAWDVIKGREGTRPAFRVGQVDAELLDEELLELLKGQVGEALKLFGVRSTDRALYHSLSNMRIVSSAGGVVFRNPPRAQGNSLQAIDLGPQRLLRCSAPKSPLYRRPPYWICSKNAVTMAEGCVWSYYRWWPLCLG